MNIEKVSAPLDWIQKAAEAAEDWTKKSHPLVSVVTKAISSRGVQVSVPAVPDPENPDGPGWWGPKTYAHDDAAVVRRLFDVEYPD